MKHKQQTYPPIIPDIEEWPIYKLHKNRGDFVQEIENFTLNKFLKNYNEQQLIDILAKTIYLEKIRMKEEPWKVDPPKERQFWKKVARLLEEIRGDQESRSKKIEKAFRMIIHRYADEIVGSFKKKTFQFADKFLTMFFGWLLNTAAIRSIRGIWGSRVQLYDKFKVKGPLEKIRKLGKDHILIVVPTHFSNLDSIMVGYAMDAILGLPSFLYGAGLNLYNTGAIAYYMNRLGAYRLDRRKKNSIYLDTLKSMSKLSIEKGTNNLFFPGGTRSRSGALEDKLKMGLLGTTVEAQRALFEQKNPKKVIIVPLVISYHFVLEGKFLIDNYLRKTGKEKYVRVKDQSFIVSKVIKFIWRFFKESNEIALSFGEPFDIFGNALDEQGNSYDHLGKNVSIDQYFISNQQLKEDQQRESVYTQRLAQKIVERYHSENIVLTSHFVAFAAFRYLCETNNKLDLFGILRLPLEEFSIDFDQFLVIAKRLKQTLVKMNDAGMLKLDDEIFLEEAELIEDGIRKLGTYHPKKPLKINKNKQIVSEDFKLLYYYHNRLTNYGLEQKIVWIPEEGLSITSEYVK